jgi:hypothetical protein
MFGRRFLGIALLLFGIFALFGVIRSSSYRAGLSEGYYLGQQQSNSSETADSPSSPSADPNQPYSGPGYHYGRGPGFGWGYRWGWHGSPFFWILGALFKFWLFLLVIGLIGRFFFWGRHGRGPGGRWGHGPWGHHHHRHGPSEKYNDDYSDEPVMKA